MFSRSIEKQHRVVMEVGNSPLERWRIFRKVFAGEQKFLFWWEVVLSGEGFTEFCKKI